jgi:hypothetical protein
MLQYLYTFNVLAASAGTNNIYSGRSPSGKETASGHITTGVNQTKTGVMNSHRAEDSFQLHTSFTPSSPSNMSLQDGETTVNNNNSSDLDISNRTLKVNVAQIGPMKDMAHHNTGLLIGGHAYVIIILSGLVLLAILFILCGLFHRAEAHKKPDPEGGLLFDNGPNQLLSSFFDAPTSMSLV